MPAFVAHSLFGADVRDAAPPELKRLIQRYPAAYEWGLQGPDLLLFNIPRPAAGGSLLNWLGVRMHADMTDELWNALLQFLRAIKGGADYELVLAYVLGFCCHYSLDCGAHPYVFYLQDKAERSLPPRQLRGIHNRLESDIDTDVYRLKTGCGIRYFRVPPCLGEDRFVRGPIARMYRVVLERVYGVHVSKQALLECFFSALLELRFVMGHTAPLAVACAADLCSRHRVSLGAHVRRTTVDTDVLNLRHAKWHDLETGECSERSYPELEAQALCMASQFQQRVWDAVQNGVSTHFSELPPFDRGRPREETV